MAKFQKGQSGNPGGKPKGHPEFIAACRKLTPEALDVITGIMRDPKTPPQTRLAAAQYLHDRGYGKPSNTLTVDGNMRVRDTRSDEEIMARVAALAAELGLPLDQGALRGGSETRH